MKLMTHIVIGYPTLQATSDLVKTMVAAGADMIELQIPFSDPMADGPTIMQACETSLKQGTTVKDAFSVISNMSQEVTVPLYIMAYYNSVFRYGPEKFCHDAKHVGVTGVIIPDMPIEEESEEHFFAYCRQYNLENIRVVSPVSPDERLQLNSQYSSGFIYATARQGITGTQQTLPQEIEAYLTRVKTYVTLPVAVGFGISKPEHIQSLKDIADIAVIGSAIVEVIERSSPQNVVQNVHDFIASLNMVK